MPKYFISTFGCQMNKADSAKIAKNLENKGHKPASRIDQADFIVVNMCSVRQTAVDRIYGKIQEIKRYKRKNPKIKMALAGCVTKKDFKKMMEHFDLFLNNKEYLKIIPNFKKQKQAFVPISYGCNNFCSYCIVPFTRGPLFCRDHKQIIKESKEAIKNKVKEIWLLGQNVNDYKDKKINFPKLLKKINDLKGEFKIYFVSSNPKDFSDELIKTIAEGEKIAKYIYLPVQSGDNKILKAMNRPYTAAKYKTLIKKIRKSLPNVKLSTDVIVGFPGETKKQFGNTKNLLKEIKFDKAFINKYSPRIGTKAYGLKDNVPLKEKKRRWEILNNLVNEK